MQHRLRTLVARISMIREFFFLGMLFVAVMTIVLAGVEHPRVAAVEAKFADTASGGLSIVPASCPSDPHSAGECDPPGNPPYAKFDSATCSFVGWALDIDTPDSAVSVDFYIYDGAPAPGIGDGLGGIPANVSRPDVCQAYGIADPTCNHGFSAPVPDKYRDGQPHSVSAYAHDTQTNDPVFVDGSPKTFTCNSSVCSNGLDNTQYPSCVCPVGFVQQGSSCVKPPDNPTHITYSCNAEGTSAFFSWDAVPGATRYYLRYSTSDGVCTPGWTMWTDNTTCYVDYFSGTSGGIVTIPGHSYRIWIHSGDPVNWANPAATPTFVCNAGGTSCNNGLNKTQYPDCLCPAGQVQVGDHCEGGGSCSNGLNKTQYPDCLCPAGQSQVGDHCEGGSGGGHYACNISNQCVSAANGPYTTSNCNGACGGGQCSNGLDRTQYPDCLCPAGQHQQGNACIAGCDARLGQRCNSSPNSCGLVDHGTYQCDSSCNAVQPDDSDCPRCAVVQGGDCVQCVPPYQLSGGKCIILGSRDPSANFHVIPSLVRQGKTSQVYWDAQNVADCTVTSTNGDGPWTGISSGAAGKTTNPILSRQTYTLFCHSLSGATVPTLTQSVIVNVIPTWQEE